MKKTIVYLLLFMLTATSVAATTNMDVTFLSQDPDPVEPGEFVDLRWRVENSGSDDLFNAFTRIQARYPFTVEDSSRKSLGTLSAIQEGEKSSIVKFRVRVDDGAAEGEEEIKVYYGADNLAGEIIDEVMISIQTRSLVFGIKKIKIMPENPAPGDTVDVNITLENMNDPALKNLIFKLDLAGTNLATVGSIDTKIVKIVPGNSEVDIPFKIFIGADVESKMHQIPLKVRFTDKFNREQELSSYFGLKVEAPPEYLINLEESTVYVAKKPGEIVLSISNIGVGNLNYMAMEILQSDAYEVISNNQIYLGNLESDDFETAEFDIFVNEYQKNVPIKTKITFKDSFNKEHEEIIDIPIRIYTQSEAQNLGLVKKRSIVGYIILLALIGGAIYYFKYYKKKKPKK